MKKRVCYNLRLKSNHEMIKQSKLKLLMENRGIFYTLILAKRALRNKMEIVLTDQAIPVMSLHYATVIRRTNRKRLNILTTFQRTMELLPPPYHSDCDPLQDRGECINRCIIDRTLLQLNLFPYSEVITETILSEYSNIRVISHNDMTNESIGIIWQDIEKQCNRACYKSKCSVVIVKTFTSHGYRSDISIELAVGSRSSPDQRAQAAPRSTLNSVFYQVFCCVNFVSFRMIQVD